MNPIIRRWIKRKYFIFIYGPSGTGKSHLARSFSIEVTRSFNMKSCIIATEVGTMSLLRKYPPLKEVEVHFSEDPRGFLNAFLKCFWEGKYVIIDTINSFYLEDFKTFKIIGFVSALSRLSHSGVLAFGQVREASTLYPAVEQAIIPWADVIAHISKNKNKYLLIIEKPISGIMAFVINDGEVRWL